jgi:hypothetical protein
MDTDRVYVLDFKAGTFESVDEETKGSGCIRTGKDIFIHEETPDQIFVLPGLAETGYLEEKHAIIVEHIVNLTKEG